MFRMVWNIKLVLEETGLAFGLKEINIFFDEPVYTAHHWRADGQVPEDKFLMYAGSAQFRQLFDDNGLAVVNNVNNLQFSCPEAYNILKEQKVTAALIYRMDSGVPGYVTFYREEQASRLWSETDKAYLNMIGKMVALTLGGK